MNASNEMKTLVFYDGACSVCAAEVTMLRRWDSKGRLGMNDIAAPDFDEGAWPVSLAEMNMALHVRLPDGAWLKGMAATRHIYRAIGRGWMVAFTGWPLLSRVFDLTYTWFARNRIPISTRLGTRRCTDGVCRIAH